ncbi:MAG TPA: FecR domain-containing protein, partial [Nitrospira sp.]|nr:FecR domain-containing protein [Nitrospira sp.]
MGTSDPNTLASTASAWLVRMETGTVTADERRLFAEWLSEDPAHPAAYREAEQFWRALDGLSADDIHTWDRFLPQESADTSTPPFLPWRRYTALAASVLLVVAIGAWAALAWLPVGDYRTAVGEQRTVALSDGSTVQLNTDTALSITMTDDARRLTLHRGEAFFTVAPDSSRPFEVTADHGVIRALGTTFNVRTEPDQTTVTVAEHGVKVMLESDVSVDVQAGERIQYHRNRWLGPVERTNMTRTLAWQRHRLVFDNDPLPVVLAELARYRSGRLVFLRDHSLNELLVTGSFDTDRLDRFLPALEESL